MPPTAVAAVTALPEMAPKSIAARMLTCARLPGSDPIRLFAKSTSRRAMPPRFISWPARTKNGIASSVKLSSPVAICWATVVTAGPGSANSRSAVAVATPML